MQKIFIIISVYLMILFSVSVVAADDKIDWNQYDSKYEGEKSVKLAIGVSALPIWSGSFNAKFNRIGLLLVAVKSSSLYFAVQSDRNVATTWGAFYLAAMFADMYHAYVKVEEYNHYYAENKVKEIPLTPEPMLIPILAFGEDNSFQIGLSFKF